MEGNYWDNAAFGTTSPAETADKPLSMWDRLFGGAMNSLATLPQRAIDASAQDVQHLGEPNYQRQSIVPALETAMTMTGGAGAFPAEANSLRMGLRMFDPPPGVSLTRKTPTSIDAHVGDKYAGSVNLSEKNPFVSSIQVEPSFQNQGIGRALYSKAERDLGQDLVPSPLGLSEQAKNFWRKELAAMEPTQASALVNKSREIGRSYGIKDADIEKRLADLLP